MSLGVAGFAARVQRERIAAAVNATEEAVAVLVGDPPADLTPDRLAEVTAEAEAARKRIETALGDARDEVASAVAVRYEWNAVRGSALLKRLIADRALFHLHGDAVPEDLEDRRRNSLVLLGALRKGSRVLVDEQGEPFSERARVRVVAPEPILTGSDGALEAY